MRIYTARKRQRRYGTAVRTRLCKRLRMNGYVMVETRHEPMQTAGCSQSTEWRNSQRTVFKGSNHHYVSSPATSHSDQTRFHRLHQHTESQCDNENLKSHKYVCITTYQPDTKSNTYPNPNPNPTTKHSTQHAVVNIQLIIVACPTYPDKFIRGNAVVLSVLLYSVGCYYCHTAGSTCMTLGSSACSMTRPDETSLSAWKSILFVVQGDLSFATSSMGAK